MDAYVIMTLEKGKVYQWEIKTESDTKEESKNGNIESIVEIDAEVDGKQISK